MNVYINYPQPHFTIHRDPDCRHIRQSGKEKPRIVKINSRNLLEELNKFGKKEYPFKADPEANDMWLDINLSSPKHNDAVVYIIQELLGQYYAPLKNAEVKICACAISSQV